MISKKTKYSLQVVAIATVFSFVLFNLVFRLIMEQRTESLKKQAEEVRSEKAKQEFIARIDENYQKLQTIYKANDYANAIELIKQFNTFGKADYKNLPEMKKEIRLYYLKNKLDFIPKIQLDEYLQLSKDISIAEDTTTEVFIRTPRYGQYFYPSEFPVTLEGTALSIKGDFSDTIVWTSSIDGKLGTGKKIQVRLSFGEHEINATGTNGITSGSMTTRINIEKNPESFKEPSRK